MYKKILVSNRAGIGDVILTTPVLKALKQKFPNSKISLLIGPNCLEVVEGLDFIDEIITFDKKTNSVLEIVKRIWRYDIALCLDFKYRTAVMAFFSAIPIRAGLKHKRKLFMTHAVEKSNRWEDTYEPCNYANVIEESAGIKLAGDLNTLYLSKTSSKDIQYINDLWVNFGIKADAPIITISPFTSWEPKNWPIDYYQKLIFLLLEEYPHQIVLVGTEADYERATVFNGVSRVTNIMGKTSLMQIAEVICRSQLFIGGCSAPLHMAAASSVPFVAFYGATSPQRWAPRTKGNVLNMNVSCSPCNGPMIGCEEKTCMYNIAVESAFEACQEMLGDKT